MKRNIWKIVTAAVLGLVVLGLVVIAVPEVFVDHHPGAPFSDKVYDGIDVSKHNGVIRWQQVAENRNIKFVYVKATEGSTLVDRRYRKNLEGAKKQGLLVGSYHLLTSKTSVRRQFDNFRRTAVKAEQDLVPFLDVEKDGIKGKWTARQLQDSVALFAQLVKQHYGRLPVIYTNEGFYEKYLAPAFDSYYLFIANYNRRPDLGSARHNLWQYSEHGCVRGIGEDVDLIKLENKTRLEQLKM